MACCKTDKNIAPREIILDTADLHRLWITLHWIWFQCIYFSLVYRWNSLTSPIHGSCIRNYRKTSGISRTKSHNLNVSCILLQLSRSIHWSQVLSWEWRCSWSSADRRCSNYIWVINNFIAYSGASYIRGFTVMARWALNAPPVTGPSITQPGI